MRDPTSGSDGQDKADRIAALDDFEIARGAAGRTTDSDGIGARVSAQVHLTRRVRDAALLSDRTFPRELGIASLERAAVLELSGNGD